MIKDEELLENTKTARNSLQADRMDMSYGEIISLYERDELIIDPEYQRLFRWSSYQQTRFIESILLGVPIPPIFVAENELGQWELVDGVQRISTVISFIGILKKYKEKNNWVLEKGDLLPSIEGFTWEKLPNKLKLNFKRSVCRVEIIKSDSELDIRYELFNRLNTGGSPLKDQEIRNCIFRGISSDFNKMLKELSDNDIFLDLLSISDTQISQLYNEEMVLRFIALVEEWETMEESSIGQFLTNYMKKAVSDSNYDFKKNKELFIRTFDRLSFYPDVFKAKNRYFSPSLFDAIGVPVARQIDKYEEIDDEQLKKSIEKIKENEELKKYMGSASAQKGRAKKRLKISTEILQV